MTTDEAAVQTFLAADFELGRVYGVPKALCNLWVVGMPRGWTADLRIDGWIHVRTVSETPA